MKRKPHFQLIEFDDMEAAVISDYVMDETTEEDQCLQTSVAEIAVQWEILAGVDEEIMQQRYGRQDRGLARRKRKKFAENVHQRHLKSRLEHQEGTSLA